MRPVFRVEFKDHDALVGSLTSLTCGEQTWVGEGFFGYLLTPEGPLPGNWEPAGERWTFKPFESHDSGVIDIGDALEVLDGYYGDRAALVLDAGREWERVTFQAYDAVRIHAPGGVSGVRPIEPEDDDSAEIVSGGWNHEHCAICWETIRPGGVGHHSLPDEWVCERCFGEYVEPRSLAFVPCT